MAREFPFFGRVKRDAGYEFDRFAEFEGTGFTGDWYPAEVEHTNTPKGGSNDLRLPGEWINYIAQLQPSDIARRHIFRIGASPFNAQGDNDIYRHPPYGTFEEGIIPWWDWQNLPTDPIMQGITSAQNLVKIVGENADAWQIETLILEDGTPDPAKVNYWKTPWLVDRKTAVSRWGAYGLSAPSADHPTYMPKITRASNKAFISKMKIERLPELPMCSKIKATTIPWLNVRYGPGTSFEKNGRVLPLQTANFREYGFVGDQIWGRLDFEHWMVLQYQLRGGRVKYYSDWEIKTPPPYK